ncbi:MAG: hypothetical protein HS113_27855 [Verrucomicrobiales bacterium]|nr:hypothetical protein [Verrucomicrobiales bacterium]
MHSIPYSLGPLALVVEFDVGTGRSFPDTAALARKRGGRLVEAIAKEFPDAVLLTLWMNSINLKAAASDAPDAILASSGYGLLPAFTDGMPDAAPPAMVWVDGCENGCYLDSAEEYLRAALEIRSWTGEALRLVSPINRPKHRQQVQAGFGFYLDMFLNDATYPVRHFSARCERQYATSLSNQSVEWCDAIHSASGVS